MKDFSAERRIRTGLRIAVERYRLGVSLTAQQNLYLSGIADAHRPAITSLLAAHSVMADPEALPPILRYAMACPALPTCGQALTESERIMPQVVAEIQAELDEVGLGDQVIHLRTTGCPNGCATTLYGGNRHRRSQCRPLHYLSRRIQDGNSPRLCLCY